MATLSNVHKLPNIQLTKYNGSKYFHISMFLLLNWPIRMPDQYFYLHSDISRTPSYKKWSDHSLVPLVLLSLWVAVSADHVVRGAAAGLPAGNAAVCAVAAAVCREEPTGGGAAVRGRPEGERAHHSRLSESAGHQAGEGYIQRYPRHTCRTRYFLSHDSGRCV